MLHKLIKILEYQVENGLSNNTVCSEIGISRKTFDNLINRKTTPQEKTRKLIDDFLKSSKEKVS